VFVAFVVVASTMELFNVNELEENVRQSIDWDVGVRNVLIIMQTTPSLFKIVKV
jgi:hypothetical protein